MTNPTLSNESNGSEQEKGAATSPDTSATSEAISAGRTDTAGDVGFLLAIETVTDAKDKEKLLAGQAFLRDLEGKSMKDLVACISNVSDVTSGYMMTGADVPAQFQSLHDDLELLRRERNIARARAELARPEPNLLKLLYYVRMASDYSTGNSDATKSDIEQLKADIDAKHLENDQVVQLRVLSATLADALPHLALPAHANSVKITVAPLANGVLFNVLSTLEFIIPKLRLDAGKNGDESKEALRVIADKAQSLAEGLREAATDDKTWRLRDAEETL